MYDDLNQKIEFRYFVQPKKALKKNKQNYYQFDIDLDKMSIQGSLDSLENT